MSPSICLVLIISTSYYCIIFTDIKLCTVTTYILHKYTASNQISSQHGQISTTHPQSCQSPSSKLPEPILKSIRAFQGSASSSLSEPSRTLHPHVSQSPQGQGLQVLWWLPCILYLEFSSLGHSFDSLSLNKALILLYSLPI